MPELPEVESVKLQFQKYLVGHKIEKAEIRNEKIFQGNAKVIEGAKVKAIRRFAKVLAIDLSSKFSLVIHIKLTGQLIYRGIKLKTKDLKLSKKVVGGLGGSHTHVIFYLDHDSKLFYNDVRRFGWIKVIKTNEVEKIGFVGKLGPEPHVVRGYEGQVFLTFRYFAEILSKTRRAIKVVLMDQSKMGGVGNIYANDALWLAKINPEIPANQLTDRKAKELFEAVHTVLKNGLTYGGASELAFVTPDGAEGEYQKHTLAYAHDGQLCTRCKKAKFEKYFLSGRGTYWCPVCQS